MREPAAGDVRATVRTAGRGVLSISTAKIYFIVAGYAVQIALPRFLGSPEAFGLYSSAMSIVSILNNVLIAATIQTVSKRVSESPADAAPALRQGLTLQLVVGGVLACSLFAAADPLARVALLDPLLAPLFRIASFVVFAYALYAALVGSLNGLQAFQRQAGLDMTYTTLRTAGILGAAALGFGVTGAIAGFAAAAGAVLTVALVVVGTGTPGARSPWKSWLAFMAPLWLYQLCLNLTLQVDLTVLKRSVAALSLAAGQGSMAAADLASRYAGFYRAAQTFSFVPYQLLLSVAFVVFPMVSHAVAIGDLDATRRYIHNALRFSLIVLLAIAAPVAGASHGVMHIAYPDAYLSGSDALSVLSLGMACFALFVVGATILSGAGRPGLAAVIAAGAGALVVVLNLAFVRLVGLGEHTLTAAATGTSLASAAALVAVGYAVNARFGAFLAPASTLRILVAGAVGFVVARVVPSTTAAGALAALCAGGGAYLVALFRIRELGATEIALVRGIVSRRKG